MHEPGFIIRVFYPKKQKLLQLVKGNNILARFYGNVCTIEY